MAPHVGARLQEREYGGRGILLGGVSGVRPAKVLVLGAGMAGMNAAWIAAGMEAEVVVIDRNLDRLRYIDEMQRGRIMTLMSDRLTIEQRVRESDVIIGTVLIPGARAPKLVTEEMVTSMRPGSVIIDISIDQGGCFETSHMTTHSDPTYVVHDVVHYCVGNMPGAVPNTSTYALTNVTLPYALAIAEHGLEDAVRADPALAGGVNAYGGQLTNRAGGGRAPDGLGPGRVRDPGRGLSRAAESRPGWRRRAGGGDTVDEQARGSWITLPSSAGCRGTPSTRIGGTSSKYAVYLREQRDRRRARTRARRPSPGFVEWLSSRDLGEGRRYRASSVARALAAVRMFHRFLLREGEADADPAAAVVRPKVPALTCRGRSRSSRSRRSWRLPATADPVALRDPAILETMYGAGLRISELVGPGRGRHRCWRTERCARWARAARSGSCRSARTPLAAVDAYLTRARPLLARARSGPALFLNQRGGRLTRQGVSKILQAAVRRAGVRKRVTPHMLRHSYRDPPAGGRRGRPRGAGAPRPCVAVEHADLHAGDGRPAPGGVLHRAPARATDAGPRPKGVREPPAGGAGR